MHKNWILKAPIHPRINNCENSSHPTSEYIDLSSHYTCKTPNKTNPKFTLKSLYQLNKEHLSLSRFPSLWAKRVRLEYSQKQFTTLERWRWEDTWHSTGKRNTEQGQLEKKRCPQDTTFTWIQRQQDKRPVCTIKSLSFSHFFSDPFSPKYHMNSTRGSLSKTKQQNPTKTVEGQHTVAAYISQIW